MACPSYDDLKTELEILTYVVGEGHHDKTIIELALEFSESDDEGHAVERAVRELVGARLLSMNRGRVVPGKAALADQPST